MKSLALTGLIAAALAGVVGFAIGRRTAARIPEVKADSGPTKRTPAEPPAPPQEKTQDSTSPTSTSTPSKEPGAPAPKDAPKPMLAKDRLFAMLLPFLSDEKKHSALWMAVVGNSEMQKRLLDILLATEDRELLEAGQDLLISMRDPELVKQVVAAYEAESNPDRKAMLAYALGGNAATPEARAVIQSILAAGDSRLMEKALTRLTVQGSGRSDNTEYVPQLRQLVMSGPTPEVRSRAARALRGDRTDEGVQFLIDRMLNDGDPEVQYQAMVALPITYSSGGFDVEKQARPLLEIAFDEKRPERMRRWAADRALMASYQTKGLITEEQKAILTELAKRKN